MADGDAAAAALVSAVRRLGGHVDGLTLRSTPRLGLCAFASAHLPAGHAAIALPAAAALTPACAAAWLCLHGGSSAPSPPRPPPSDRAQLLAYLVACRLGAPGCSLVHVAYAASLPAGCDSPLLWPPSDLAALDGTDAARTLALQRRELERQHGRLLRAYPRLQQAPPGEPLSLTLDALLWAHAAHASRCFPASMLPGGGGGAAGAALVRASHASGDDVDDAAATGILLPVLDALNHGVGGCGAGVRWDAAVGVASLSRPRGVSRR